MLYAEYDNDLFMKCLAALERKWVEPQVFGILRFEREINAVPPEKTAQLLFLLRKYNTQEVLSFIVVLFDSIPFDDSAQFDSAFVFDVLSNAIPSRNNQDQMSGYYWKKVCQKFIAWDQNHALPLLDALLVKMGEGYMSYDHGVELLAHELVQADPTGAWQVIKRHFEAGFSHRCGNILNWLKGVLGDIDADDPRGAIADLPIADIVDWIEQDSEARSALIARAAPKTLDDADGGQFTRILLHKYGHFEDVRRGAVKV